MDLRTMKDRIIIITLITIMILNAIDVFFDIKFHAPLWHILQEGSVVFISACAAVFLIIEMRKRSHALTRLKSDISLAERQIQTLHSKMEAERKEYGAVIKNQFNDWGLTMGEQQVAILVLKGLTLKEISALRNTKETTVRQQASIVYAKSNLQGRHEFSAWFLDDFLNFS